VEKLKVLANYLECDIEDLEVSSYNDCSFESGNAEYLVLTDEEADEKTLEYIKDTLWAFNADFIVCNSNMPNEQNLINSIKKMQHELCEDANPLIEALIEDIDDFVESAIQADGRGHFLSGYDGEEIEEDEYYIYRTN